MANIINGTDTGSGGLITTGDSSDELQLQTAETARVTLTNTAVVVNEGGNDVDFRVEGDTDANALFVDAGNDRVGVKTATPAVALDVVGQVRASTGILFGSDTAAANALDDYEEGTWTPTLNTGTVGNAVGVYVKIGSFIWLKGSVSYTITDTSSDYLRLGGLPFSIPSDADNRGYQVMYAGGASGTFAWETFDGSGNLALSKDGTTFLGNRAVFSGVSFQFNFFYPAVAL